MSDQFHIFGEAVHAQFTAMSKKELYTVTIEGDELYAAYQAAFPEGTNPMFRAAREHECSTCKNFIRNLGPVVSLNDDGSYNTVWDVAGAMPAMYATVAGTLAALIKTKPVTGIYRAEMPTYGVQKNRELRDGVHLQWHHFYGKVATRHFAGKKVGEQVGQAAAAFQVFQRGMKEITRAAIDDVYGLLNSKLLYRGDEFAFAFGNFVGMHGKYHAMKTEAEKQAYLWQNINEPAARLRNTAFGTILIDLSEGLDMESAVKKYEVVMAPANYKRPSALITPSMVKAAMATITELGLESALQRRFARIEDVSVNDILFVDNDVRAKMKDSSVAGLLMDVAAKQTVHAEPANAVDISIEEFLKTVAPKAKSMSVFIKNAMQSNFVSLTAPVNADAGSLFKWDNNFAWSYDGNITDSIKERVKAAGGRTSAVLRVSLAWQNSDDLDLHVHEPDRNHIYFGSRGRASRNTGELDVDMNRSSSGHEFSATDPVENVTWSRPMDGQYKVVVNNYNKRSTANQGFTLEVESAAGIHQFSAQKSPSSGQDNNALIVTVKGGVVTGITTGAGITGGAFSQEKWGIATEKYAKVDTLMLSPNHWGERGVGNKHVIFVLEGAKNPVPTRGIYNEFLKPELDKHRKVFEVLGNKTMADPTDNQLSGVGFSRAGETVHVLVDGRRNYNVIF